MVYITSSRPDKARDGGRGKGKGRKVFSRSIKEARRDKHP